MPKLSKYSTNAKERPSVLEGRSDYVCQYITGLIYPPRHSAPRVSYHSGTPVLDTAEN